MEFWIRYLQWRAGTGFRHLEVSAVGERAAQAAGQADETEDDLRDIGLAGNESG